MSDSWNDLPKIKMDNLNLDETVSDYYQEESKNFKEDFSGKDDYVAVEVEKPDENKIKKIALFWSIVFFVVTIPIMYHYAKFFIQAYFMQNDYGTIEVKTTTLNYRDLYDVSEVTGLISPETSVDIVARVDGYLENTYFKEGDFINKGQLLFTIEPNEYKIAVRAADAEVAQAQAIYTNSLQELERAKVLVKENFISRSDYDSIVANASSSRASLDAANQSLARAKLNLSYTNIYSPLSGKAGKITMSIGNYVGLQSGPLVNIAKMNPICVDFSMKSSDVLRMKQGNSGNLDINTAKVELLLSDDTKYNKVGRIVFSNNAVSSEAASLSLKAVFENPDNMLIPGDYVRVIITSKDARRKLVVPQSITHGDALNGYYVWVVKDNHAIKKKFEISGSNQTDWIVESGLDGSETVVKYSNRPIDMDKAAVVVKN